MLYVTVRGDAVGGAAAALAAADGEPAPLAVAGALRDCGCALIAGAAPDCALGGGGESLRPEIVREPFSTREYTFCGGDWFELSVMESLF
jgi:hypothetical protein